MVTTRAFVLLVLAGVALGADAITYSGGLYNIEEGDDRSLPGTWPGSAEERWCFSEEDGSWIVHGISRVFGLYWGNGTTGGDDTVTFDVHYKNADGTEGEATLTVPDGNFATIHGEQGDATWTATRFGILPDDLQNLENACAFTGDDTDIVSWEGKWGDHYYCVDGDDVTSTYGEEYEGFWEIGTQTAELFSQLADTKRAMFGTWTAISGEGAGLSGPLIYKSIARTPPTFRGLWCIEEDGVLNYCELDSGFDRDNTDDPEDKCETHPTEGIVQTCYDITDGTGVDDIDDGFMDGNKECHCVENKFSITGRYSVYGWLYGTLRVSDNHANVTFHEIVPGNSGTGEIVYDGTDSISGTWHYDADGSSGPWAVEDGVSTTDGDAGYDPRRFCLYTTPSSTRNVFGAWDDGNDGDFYLCSGDGDATFGTYKFVHDDDQVEFGTVEGVSVMDGTAQSEVFSIQTGPYAGGIGGSFYRADGGPDPDQLVGFACALDNFDPDDDAPHDIEPTTCFFEELESFSATDIEAACEHHPDFPEGDDDDDDDDDDTDASTTLAAGVALTTLAVAAAVVV